MIMVVPLVHPDDPLLVGTADLIESAVHSGAGVRYRTPAPAHRVGRRHSKGGACTCSPGLRAHLTRSRVVSTNTSRQKYGAPVVRRTTGS